MTENLIIISIIGLVLGFLLSIPAGGPTSLVILSNALKGRIRYCNLVNYGAGIADFVYVFLSVYGLTAIYNLYQPFAPYVLLAGAILVMTIGIKITRTNPELEVLEQSAADIEAREYEKRGGFLTGLMLGFLNPTLLISWISSSFLVFTMLASFGFDTGGLDQQAGKQLQTIKSQGMIPTPSDSISNYIPQSPATHSWFSQKQMPDHYPFLLSLFYALFVTIGTVSWFYYLTFLIAKHRQRINSKIIHTFIHVLGWILCVLGILLCYKGLNMVFRF